MGIKRAPLVGAIIYILLMITGCTTNNDAEVSTSTLTQTEEIDVSSSAQIVEEPAEPTINYINLGTFKISAYCHCSKCCGKSDGITATGTKVQANRTIAVDPKVIPLGSQVIIDGQTYTYVAEDTGGAIKDKKIDLYFPTHREALNWGIQYKEVSLVK